MSRRGDWARSFAGSEEDFPTYIVKVLGLDRTWMDHGACRNHELARKRAWTCRPNETVVVAGRRLDPKELIEAALMICSTCPAQYQCARWALEVREESGTWGMRHDDLLWLTRQPNGPGVIDEAERANEPVQVVVRRHIQGQRRAARDKRRSAEV